MDYLPPDKKKKGEVTATRFVLWVVVGGVGLWMLGSGILGIITAG